MKIYFDSDIWIDYAWGIINGTGRRKKYINDLVSTIKEKKIKVVSSLFLNTEISAHFRDWFILRKVVRDGFSYRELTRLKKQYDLNERERKKINKTIQNIIKLPWVRFVELKGLDKGSLDVFEVLTLEYLIDAIDAFHNVIAANENCRFFITKDDDMRERMNWFLEDVNLQHTFWVCRPREFLDKIKSGKSLVK